MRKICNLAIPRGTQEMLFDEGYVLWTGEQCPAVMSATREEISMKPKIVKPVYVLWIRVHVSG
jgi:hypothetical protein